MQLLDGSGTLKFSWPLLCRPVPLCKVVLHNCCGRSKVLLLSTERHVLSAAEVYQARQKLCQ